MAQTEFKVKADVSDAVKGIKALIKLLRTLNRELKTFEALRGTTSESGTAAMGGL